MSTMDDKTKDFRVVEDFEEYAMNYTFSDVAKLFYSAGAGSRSTPKESEIAFHRYRIRPRRLRNVQNIDLRSSVLDRGVSCPIGVSPTALHGFANPEGELATSAGCSQEECVFVLSSSSSKSVEEVAQNTRELNPSALLWMQMYLYFDKDTTLSLVRKAEDLNFDALVVTVDLCTPGQIRSYLSSDVMEEVLRRSQTITVGRREEDACLTWEDLKWLKGNTRLPIVVKGILTEEDALESVRCGANAIWVSNHGSRLIRRCVSPIEVLEEVVTAVRDTGVEVYLDGGVRSGTDIFIALALGAKAVFIGRPILWGLATSGEKGVRQILQILKKELLKVMMLSGVNKLEDINKSYIVRT